MKNNPFATISFRLFVFNLLLVFIPVIAFFFLRTHEQQLLDALEHALVQQGRIISAALGEGESISEDEAVNLLRSLRKEHEARIRIISPDGTVLADSSVLPEENGDAAEPEEEQEPQSEKQWDIRGDRYAGRGDTLYPTVSPPPAENEEEKRNIRESLIYRIATFPVRLVRRYVLPPSPPVGSGDFYQGKETLLGPEVKRALSGEYGAATRLSSGGQISVTLYSALPVRGKETIIGAVLISQSSYRILQDIYLLRIDIFRIFLFSLLASIILSIFLSLTISRPLKKLSLQSETIFTPRGKISGKFTTRKRRDEIGTLARALDTLTGKVEKHIQFIEAFAADVAHELRNPIASIRSAAEMAGEADNREDVEKFIRMIGEETSRMERLLFAIRDMSAIDTRLQEETMEMIDMRPFLTQVLEVRKLRKGEKELTYTLTLPENPVYVRVNDARISQIMTNILDNCADFSPDGGTIAVTLTADLHWIEIGIRDSGPGIPDHMREQIFNRFYTTRKTGHGDSHHSGLGLAIARAIARGYGGDIHLADSGPDKTGKPSAEFVRAGAAFIVRLPRSFGNQTGSQEK